MSDGPTLYLIDDDAAVRDSIDMLLQSYGIPVRAYASGTAFLRDLPTVSSGCLLIDINARGANGLELLDQLRMHGLAIPTIVMISGETFGTRVDPIETTILQEPIAPAELVVCVEKALGGYHA